MRKLVVLLVLVGLFSYLVLPGLIENQIADRLQIVFGSATRPDVEISSNFPPELLMGRIDRIQVSVEQGSLQGVALYNTRMDLKGVNVSVPSLLQGSPIIESESCSLSVEVPAVLIDQNEVCLNYLGLGSVL
ncbi:MAG TPA: LmeA family phospholipid-binding protein [Rubrobacter sp.]|nr:LmeA family phospholipid-binding protein [Rubrobacter sp.]